MVARNYTLGNNTFGLGPFMPGLQGGPSYGQSLPQIAETLNRGVKGKDPAALISVMMALSQVPATDLALVFGMLDPEVLQQLTEAMSQSAFNPQTTGGGGSGGNGRNALGGGSSGAMPAASGPQHRSTAGAQGTPDVGAARNLTAEQKANARIIIEEGRKLGASDRDIQIALMTAMQESSLKNLSGGDRDSAGLFQQRPSQGWGTFAQVTDPRYAAQKFYKTLFGVKNRDSMSLTQAAQTVQRSAYPDAYAKWEGLARALMS